MTDATLPPPDPGERLPSDDADAVLAAAASAVDAVAEQVDADMDALDVARRLLLVHAHPDDETIGTGVTMAKYAAEHARVTLVTCTLGEQGEVLVPELAHLAADQQDALGQHRIGELAAALEALRVTDSRFLGGPGRWRDSGMMGTPTNERPDCFWQADLGEAVEALVAVVREVRPQVVVTYDERGGYGHPDHIQAHRVTLAAVEAAADPSYVPALGEVWAVDKVYATAVPKSVLQAGVDRLRSEGHASFSTVDSVDDLPFGNPDEQVTTEITAPEQLEGKLAALRAHRTQIAVDGAFFALADGVGQLASASEHFVLVRGPRGPGSGPHGREDDLFAGLGLGD